MKDMMRFSGGPLDAMLYPAPRWPPPEEISAEEVELACAYLNKEPQVGTYKRVSYSALPDEVRDKPNVFRGGQYEWAPSE